MHLVKFTLHNKSQRAYKDLAKYKLFIDSHLTINYLCLTVITTAATLTVFTIN